MSDKVARHWGLVKGMSEKVGVDLGRRVVEGTLAPADLSAVVTTCTRCESVEECEKFLGADPGRAQGACAGPADALPDYCLNRPLFSILEGD